MAKEDQLHSDPDWVKRVQAHGGTGKPPRPGWPVGVSGLSLAGGDKLGVDADGNLYWDGRPLQVGHKLDLSKAQFVLLILATAGTVIAGLVALLDWLNFQPFR
jgi:hypothetical protein